MVKIYLDNSALNRPFDNQSVPKIRLETVATLFILKLIDNRKLRLVDSSVIEYENSKNPFFERRVWISSYLAEASFYQKIDSKIRERSEEIEKSKISSIDSLHLASAETAEVNYFITCDDDIIKRYKGKLKVVDPIDFIKIFKSK